MKAFRQFHGISLQRLAKDIGRDAGYLSRVERGQQGAGEETLRLYAQRLHVPITAITHEETPRDQERPGAPHRGSPDPADHSRHDLDPETHHGSRAAEHGTERE